MKKIILVLLPVLLFVPTVSYAVLGLGPCGGMAKTGITGIDNLLSNVCSYIFVVVGLAIIIGFMMSALYFILAKGSPEGLTTARNWLIYSLVATIVLGAIGVLILIGNTIMM